MRGSKQCVIPIIYQVTQAGIQLLNSPFNLLPYQGGKLLPFVKGD